MKHRIASWVCPRALGVAPEPVLGSPEPATLRVPRIRASPGEGSQITLNVDGSSRTCWVTGPPAGETPPPLLLVLHGLGAYGSRMARWTGIGTRGPAAGFCCAFPDALNQVWDDHGCGRRDGIDDPSFIAALVEELARTGAADPDRIVVTGVSSGASFAERVVRTGQLRARGMALVAGTARAASVTSTPISGDPTAVLILAGTADPMLPYEGGLPHGPIGRLSLRQIAKYLNAPGGHESEAPETLAAAWAAVNGCAATPAVETLPGEPQSFAIDRLRWTPSTPRAPGVVAYRVHHGGHGWPGARQYLPGRLIGRIPQNLDGTALLFDFAREALAAD